MIFALPHILYLLRAVVAFQTIVGGVKQVLGGDATLLALVPFTSGGTGSLYIKSSSSPSCIVELVK